MTRYITLSNLTPRWFPPEPEAQLIPLHDSLSGRLTNEESLEDWFSMRIEFSSRQFGEDADRTRWLEAATTSAGRLREAINERAELVVLSAPSLYEQVLVCWAYRYLRDAELTILLVPPREGEPYNVLARTTEAEWARASTLDLARHRKDLSSAWAAITAPTPERLASIALPEFLDRLPLLLDRLPHPESGLNSIQRTMLREIRSGARTTRVIGNLLSSLGAKGDRMGDHTLFRDMLAMAAASKPLLTVDDPRAPRFATFELTPFGERCMAGDANHFLENRCEKWVGGTHLSVDEGTVWFWDGAALTSP